MLGTIFGRDRRGGSEVTVWQSGAESRARAARRGHGEQIWIRVLYPGKRLGGLHGPLQAFVIEFIGGGTRGSAFEDRADRYAIVLFRDILMNDVVRKASEGKLAAIEKRFHIVGGGEFPDATKMPAALSLVSIQHSAVSSQPARRSASTLRMSDASIRLTSTTLCSRVLYSSSIKSSKSRASKK